MRYMYILSSLKENIFLISYYILPYILSIIISVVAILNNLGAAWLFKRQRQNGNTGVQRLPVSCRATLSLA